MTDDLVQISLQIPRSTLNAFDKVAKALGMSRNKLAQKAFKWIGHGEIDVSIMLQQDIKQITGEGKE